MQTILSEKKAFQKATNLKLGRKIYSGDGNIYHLKEYPNRLVKIVPLDNGYNTESHHSHSLNVLKYIQRSKNASLVKVHQVGTFFSESPYCTDGCHHYYYIMDKLKLLPRKNRSFYIDEIRGVLNFGDRRPEKGVPRKVQNFIKRARKLKYKHCDIHEWNIMQDRKGTLKFIDLESFMYGDNYV